MNVLTGVLAWFALSASASAASAQPSPPTQLPMGDLGDLVQLGKQLFEHTGTHPLTRGFVGNALTCASCHPEGGAQRHGNTLIGVAAAYPAWSPREKAVITLEDRVLNCFMRSLNGARPPSGSKPSLAMTAYLTWLSTGTPIEMNDEAPFGPNSFPKLDVNLSSADVESGKKVYQSKCVACHGRDGQGDPPVWGPRSFNAGASLAKVPFLASWVRVTMPLGDPSLTEREAVDVAAYIDSHPRPDFVLREHLPRDHAPPAYNSNVLDEVVRAPTWPPRR